MLDLFQSLPQVGTVNWIGLRPGKRQPMTVVNEVEVCLEQGLIGDRYSGKPGGKRMVTLIQAEHLEVMAKLLGETDLPPSTLRRNIVVSGINLLSLKAPGQEFHFKIGEAILQMTGPCHPCSRMEEVLGPGGYNAMRGHGGITASVIKAGKVSLGDCVELVID